MLVGGRADAFQQTIEDLGREGGVVAPREKLVQPLVPLVGPIPRRLVRCRAADRAVVLELR